MVNKNTAVTKNAMRSAHPIATTTQTHTGCEGPAGSGGAGLTTYKMVNICLIEVIIHMNVLLWLLAYTVRLLPATANAWPFTEPALIQSSMHFLIWPAVSLLCPISWVLQSINGMLFITVISTIYAYLKVTFILSSLVHSHLLWSKQGILKPQSDTGLRRPVSISLAFISGSSVIQVLQGLSLLPRDAVSSYWAEE